MKIILSRKGFDSAAGGFASPILPDGQLFSLPIPGEGDVRYSDLVVCENPLTGKTVNGLELLRMLSPKIVISGKGSVIQSSQTCHLDPDLRSDVIVRPYHKWQPAFGQVDAAETHLRNQGVGVGDLFLYFGWFRKTFWHDGKLRFDPKDKNGRHIIFGYMQIGEKLEVVNNLIPDWLKAHPHATHGRYKHQNNSIYLASDNLSLIPLFPGAGLFDYHPELVLTKPGMTRTKWQLPDIFRKCYISYHKAESWKEGYFQSVARGQEFVVEESQCVVDWATDLILTHGEFSSVPNSVATSKDWKTTPMSQDQITYNFDYQFSREEMAYIRRGVIPEQMEDKWFIYFEDDVLYFHRSWTGVAIYEVHFEETRVKKIRICRDKKFYTETDDQYDIAMVKFMIDCFLLKKSSPYPRRKGEGDEEHALGMWSNMGRAMMKKE